MTRRTALPEAAAAFAAGAAAAAIAVRRFGVQANDLAAEVAEILDRVNEIAATLGDIRTQLSKAPTVVKLSGGGVAGVRPQAPAPRPEPTARRRTW